MVTLQKQLNVTAQKKLQTCKVGFDAEFPLEVMSFNYQGTSKQNVWMVKDNGFPGRIRTQKTRGMSNNYETLVSFVLDTLCRVQAMTQ